MQEEEKSQTVKSEIDRREKRQTTQARLLFGFIR
jgi:hypothetical protein